MLPVRISACFRRSGLLLALLPVAVAGRQTLQAQTGGGSAMGMGSAGAVPSGTVSGVISGQVLNASTGLPVARALVRFDDRVALTDHDGKFEFDQLEAVGGNLMVRKPGFYFSTDVSDAGGEYVRVGQTGDLLLLRLYPEALLTGTLTAPDGDPLPRILVSALRSVFDDEGHRWIPAAQTQTDSHGNFRLPVPAGDYRLETRYTPRSSAAMEAVLPVLIPDESSLNTLDVIRIRSGEEQHFDLRPAISRTHTVTATLESGSERAFPRISARSANGAMFPISAVRTGASGVYRMDLPSGTYTLTASRNSPDGFEEAETAVTVEDRDVSGVVLRFSPLPSVPVEMLVDQAATSDNAKPNLLQLGLTLQNNQPDSGQGVFGMRLSPQRDRGLAFTVSPGSYHFEARNSGAWYIKSASYGDSDLLQQDLVVAPGSGGTPIRVMVSNQTGVLQGTVKLNGDGAPCWIYLVPTTPSAKPVMSLRSNSDGAYSFASLAPGIYQAIAFEHRHAANYRDPASLAPYSAHVRSITVNPGDKPTLDLDAVSGTELVP